MSKGSKRLSCVVERNGRKIPKASKSLRESGFRFQHCERCNTLPPGLHPSVEAMDYPVILLTEVDV